MVTQKPDGKVEFRFFRPEARQLTLAGDFNNWHETCLPMSREPDGWWRYELRLAPGCYQFRYRSDREWYTDYAAFGVEPGPFGFNSVVKVDPVDNEGSPAGRTRTVEKLPHVTETEPHRFVNRGRTAQTADELWVEHHRDALAAALA